MNETGNHAIPRRFIDLDKLFREYTMLAVIENLCRYDCIFCGILLFEFFLNYVTSLKTYI